jgi:putative transposase
MLGAHSDTLLLAHVIWATSNRRATLVRDFDGWFADFAADACRRIECDLLAIGNSSDHVHVVLRLSPSVALAEAVRRLKGGSSYAWNARERGRPLHWQTGYWARSIEQEGLAPLMAYVRDQRARHAAATTLAAWEQHEATQPP